MTREKTDFLAACKANDSRNKALEEIRDRGADVILSVFRLLKNSLVHAVGNQAVTTTAKETHATLVDFASVVGGQVSITFVDDTIFVCGQLLRAPRTIYESAMEVGKLLSVCGASEVSFTATLAEADLLLFCEVFSNASRDPSQRHLLTEAKFDNIVVRKLLSSLHSKQEDDGLPPLEKALRVYASALVVMRQFYDRIAQGKTVLPHRVKRIAQRIVVSAEQNESAIMTMSTLANAHRDEAGRAVQAALLAVMVARRLTDDRGPLSQLAMAALIADLGRVRISGSAGERLTTLSDEVERVVPALTSSLAISTGGVNVPNAVRTVTAFETTYLERHHVLGPLYKRAMSPLLQSKILFVVRLLLEKLAPRDTTRPMSPLDALAAIAGQPNVDETVYRLLIQALGVLPTGTVVEFESGEWGVVVGPSSNPTALAHPRVRLVTDRNGQIFSDAREVDLGATMSGAKAMPRITNILEPNKAKFNVTSVLMRSPKVTRPVV